MSGAPEFDFGTVWSGRTPAVHVEYPSRVAAFARAQAALAGDPPRSVVVVGEPGVGAEAFARELARRLKRSGHVLEASPFQLNAAMRYIGDLEGRVADLVAASREGRLTWFAPAFQEVAVAGVWERDPHGLLGKIAPHLIAGEVRMVAVATSTGWAALVRRRPELASAVEVIRLEALTRPEAMEAAVAWLERAGQATPDPDVLREAIALATEQLGDALPGPLLRLISEAVKSRARKGRDGAVELGDLVEALATVTGLPRVLVDPAEHLDLDRLRTRFESVVIGQPEAVTAIVERLAMAKAGLTDPTRPLAVMLFVGPTGTGKTELAKQLAVFLSGSASGLIRFDMTEFQGNDAAERLLGGDAAPGSASGLVAAVSANPASVVLLDEFEKAHPSVWDVFLQIFDDARASNSRGDVASFRHAIVIMTSNLGAGARASTAVGFGAGAGTPPAAGAAMLREVEQAFRPEFVNRIDRIIAFRSLTRGVMRQIVRKELAGVEELRGLRTRPWAIEWDDSAVEALLREGFTADMGARPLKRAIERHVLAPLARSIVEHEVPSGDQFLFVRAGSDAPVEVQFVDPDTPEDAGPPVRPRHDTDVSSARAIAIDPLGTAEERDVLVAALEPVRARIDARAFRARKDGLLALMAATGFWEDPGRQAVLAEAERLDRLEAGLRTGVALADRLTHVAGRAGAAELTRLLAQRVFLLEQELAALDGGEPRDAWLLIRPVADAGDPAWPGRLVAMYRGWGQLRGMTIADEPARAGDGGHLLDVSGFAAFRLLRHETGLHVWETPKDGARGGVVRHAALVVCLPQHGGTPEIELPAPRKIVRRYRELPSPLVRDLAQGWRTGRLATVLAGNFDLIA